MAWRDDASEEVQSDLDAVFSQAALLARTLLTRNREFFPFGATISTKGAVGLSTPVPAEAAPTVHDVIEAIRTELRHDKAERRAYAMVALARTADGAEAVRIELEHKEGVALVIGMPVMRGKSGAVTFGAMAAHPGQRLIWPPAASPSAKASSSKKAPAKAPAEAVAKAPAKAATKAATKAAAKAPAKAAAKAPAKPARKPRGTAIATA